MSEEQIVKDLIYPLTDALQMKLYVKLQGFGYKIVEGEQIVLQLPFAKGVGVEFAPEVCASDVDYKAGCACVLVKVFGGLWALVAYSGTPYEASAQAGLTVTLIDGYKCGLNRTSAPLFNGVKSCDILKKLKKGVIRQYTKDAKTGPWVLYEPKAGAVDSRPERRTKKV